jgi:benzoyl-CoA reductase subunit D
MLTAGIDCGAKTIKTVILKDGKILGQSIVLAGLDTKASTEQSLAQALAAAGVKKEELKKITATGSGKKAAAGIATNEVTEVTANARGVFHHYPSARTVIDVGAEEGRGIKIDNRGKVADFATNEKCAAGAGAFTEAMARALEVKLEEFGPFSLKSTKSVPMNAQCAVFAESEVVTLVHAKTPKEDIARAVMDAIASRITSMVSRIGLEKDAVLIGGLAKNIGFVEALKRGLNTDVIVPAEPEFIGALGAAIIAAESAGVA